MTGARRALLVDYGGVLTGSMRATFERFEREEGLAAGSLQRAMVAVYERGGGSGLIEQVERGEVSDAEFERQLAEAFSAGGHDIPADGLRRRLFADLRPEGRMWDVVDRARDGGVVTCLLSNSWGSDGYPMDRLRASFDHVVLSGEVGMRKPDREIFEHAADVVGLALDACAFVDDLAANVEAATGYGLHAVRHTGDAEATARALEPFLGVSLVDATA